MISSKRLDLVPASPESVRAAISDRGAMAAILDARIPASWPPELLDDDALRWMLGWLADPANDRQWGMYWIILRDPRTLVGTCGFKGMPREGAVEIGYGIVSGHQRRGYATEATEALVRHAFANAAVDRVIAETLPGLVASIGVLEKNGFEFIGDGSEPGVIRYEVARP